MILHCHHCGIRFDRAEHSIVGRDQCPECGEPGEPHPRGYHEPVRLEDGGRIDST